MILPLKRLVAAIVIVSFASAACSTGGSADSTSDRSDETPIGDGDGDDAVATALDDINWEYQSFDSAVSAEECQSLDSAEFSDTELTPYEVVTVSFDCVVDAEQLSLEVGGSEVELIQITSTTLAFVIPSDAPPGEGNLSLSGLSASTMTEALVVEPLPAVDNPRAYLNEQIETLEALAETIDEPSLAEVMRTAVMDAKSSLGALSDEEAAEAAALWRANEASFGLVEKAVCQIQGSSPEDWWSCFTDVVEERVGVALVSAAAAKVSFVAAGTSIWSGVGGVVFGLVGTLATGTTAYNVAAMVDEMANMARRVMQVIAIEIGLLKAVSVESGEAITLDVEASYTTLSGASLGSDSSAVVAFRVVVARGIDLVRKVEGWFGTSIEVYSLDVGSLTESSTPDDTYISLSATTPPNVTKSISGRSVTFTSTAQDPVPVSIDVTYRFSGVREITRSFDVVVQPVSCILPACTASDLAAGKVRCSADDSALEKCTAAGSGGNPCAFPAWTLAETCSGSLTCTDRVQLTPSDFGGTLGTYKDTFGSSVSVTAGASSFSVSLACVGLPEGVPPDDENPIYAGTTLWTPAHCLGEFTHDISAVYSHVPPEYPASGNGDIKCGYLGEYHTATVTVQNMACSVASVACR